MPDSTSSQEPFLDPPPGDADGPVWAQWAVEFLDRFCRMWNDWRDRWGYCEVPITRQGNPDAFLILERVTRQVGTSQELVTGNPPPGILDAPPLLDECSHAVQRFSDQSIWRFDSAEQANEVAKGLLEVAHSIQNRRYQSVRQASLERISQLMKMATRRTVRKQDPSVDGIAKGGRPCISETEAQKREQLVERWIQARNARVCQKDFCVDEGVSLIYLTKCVTWLTQRRRRENKS